MKRALVGAACAAALCAGTPAASAQAGMDSITPMNADASSTLKGKGEKYAAWRAIDGDQTTGWCEGKKDQGVGEALTLSGDDVSFTQLQIMAGYWKSEKLFKGNNRPTALTVTVTNHDGQTQRFDVAVPDGMEAAVLDPGQVVDATEIKIAFAGVTKGKVNDSCITDVQLVNGEQTRVPFLEGGAAFQDLGTAIDGLSNGLASCDQTALSTYVKFPLSYKSLPDPGGMVKPIKKKWKKLKDLMKSCAKGEQPTLGGEVDYTWLRTEGPGKVMMRAGGGNEAGSPWWHFSFQYDDEGGGTWLLTSADYH